MSQPSNPESGIDELQVPGGVLATPYSPITSNSPLPAAERSGLVVFSGGSAANSLVEVFENVREANKCSLSYVIPISDNGGSTSEIIRVFGGPGSFPPTADGRCTSTWRTARLTSAR